MKKIDSGGQLPELKLRVGESGGLALPGDIGTDYAIVLFYRGHW
jgi:hypothetical protein